MIFDETNFKPWEDIKYAKRLKRILYLYIFYLFSNKVKINDGRELDTDNTLHITRDSKLDNILSQLFYANEPKLNFNVSKAYDYRAVAKYLKKNDLPVEWAKDLKQETRFLFCNIEMN